MSSPKRRLVVVAAAMLGSAVLVGAGIICRDFLLEPWYLYRLRSDDSSVRDAAADRLGRIKSVKAIPLLIKALTKHEKISERTSVVQRVPRRIEVGIVPTSITRALVEIGRPAVPALIELLENPNPLPRAYAAATLRRIGPEAGDAVSVLTSLLEDENDLVANAAARALSDIRPAQD